MISHLNTCTEEIFLTFAIIPRRSARGTSVLASGVSAIGPETVSRAVCTVAVAGKGSKNKLRRGSSGAFSQAIKPANHCGMLWRYLPPILL